MKANKVNADKMKYIREYLPHGAILLLAKKTGYKVYYVQRVLDGKIMNLMVTEEALKIVLVEKAKIDALAAQLDSIFK